MTHIGKNPHALRTEAQGGDPHAAAGMATDDANALRLVARKLVADVLAQTPDADVRAGVSRVCTLAHRSGLPVERVITILRTEWDGAGGRFQWQPETPEAMRARLVTRCIRQFYDMER